MNLPTKITLLRVVLIPAYLFVYIVEPLSRTPNLWLAITIFSIAAITDAVDGYLARKYRLVTNFGKLIDPLADKLLVCAALVAFTASGALPAWAVIILISREFYISGLRQLAVERGIVLAASAGGKIKTATQITLICYVLMPIEIFRFDWMVTVLLVITLIASVLSAADYTVKNRAVFSQDKGTDS